MSISVKLIGPQSYSSGGRVYAKGVPVTVDEQTAKKLLAARGPKQEPIFGVVGEDGEVPVVTTPPKSHKVADLLAAAKKDDAKKEKAETARREKKAAKKTVTPKKLRDLVPATPEAETDTKPKGKVLFSNKPAATPVSATTEEEEKELFKELGVDTSEDPENEEGSDDQDEQDDQDGEVDETI